MRLFVLLNLIVVTTLLYLLLKDRRKQKPSKLNLQRNNRPLHGKTEAKNISSDSSEKQLNVLFNYNGETWDAYEILGLPAGASEEEVSKAYAQQQESQQDAGLIKAAYEAIQNS